MRLGWGCKMASPAGLASVLPPAASLSLGRRIRPQAGPASSLSSMNVSKGPEGKLQGLSGPELLMNKSGTAKTAARGWGHRQYDLSEATMVTVGHIILLKIATSLLLFSLVLSLASKLQIRRDVCFCSLLYHHCLD